MTKLYFDKNNTNSNKILINNLSLSYNYTSNLLYNRLNKSKEIEVKKDYKLKMNEIVIGFKSVEYYLGNEVKVDLKLTNESGNLKELKSRGFLLLSRKGDGKTVMASILINWYREKFKIKDSSGNIINLPVFIIDPKGEYYTRSKESYYNRDEDFKFNVDGLLSEYNLKRKGFDLIVIRPKFLGEQSDVNFYYSIHFLDFKRIMKRNSTVSISILFDLLGLTNNEANQELLELALSNDKITSWIELGNYILKLKKEFGIGAVTIINKIRVRLRRGILTDKDEERFNLLENLANKIVVFRGDIRNEVDDNIHLIMYNAYIKFALQLIIDDADGASKNNKDSYLKNPAGYLIVCDETDSICPREGKNSLKNTYIQLLTKYRAIMINTISITQNPDKLAYEIIKECDFVLGSTCDNIISDTLIKIRGITPKNVYFLKTLKREVLNSIGLTINEWYFVDINNFPIIFYPFIPTQAYKEQTSN